MAVPYMKMYWGDYLQDTMGLSDAMHGNYLLLIASYFCTGEPLLDNDELLAGIAKCSLDVWLTRRPILERYFQTGDGFWRHRRVEEEIVALGARTTRSRNGGNAKKQKLAEQQEVVNYKLTNAMSDVRCQMSDVIVQTSEPAAQERVTPSAVADDLATLCNRHGMNYEAMAMLVRQGYGASEIEFAILKAKANGKTPNNWAPYLKKLCDSERENPTPPAPPPKEGPKVIKLSEAERAMIEGRRNHEGLQATT